MLFGEGLADLLGGLLGGGGGGLTQVLMIALLAWMAFKGKTPSPSPAPAPVVPVPQPSPTPAPSDDANRPLLQLLTRLAPALQDLLERMPKDAPLLAGEAGPSKELALKVVSGFKEISEDIHAASSEGGAADPGRREAAFNKLVAFWPLVELVLRMQGLNVPSVAFRAVQAVKAASTIRLSDGLSEDEIAKIRSLLAVRNSQSPEISLNV